MQELRRAIFIAFILLTALYSFPVLAAEEPAVSALAAILIDRDSGRILWAKDARRRLPIWPWSTAVKTIRSQSARKRRQLKARRSGWIRARRRHWGS